MQTSSWSILEHFHHFNIPPAPPHLAITSPPAQVSLRTPLSLPGRPGHHKLGISNGLRGFCLLLMGSSSAPCLHRWPVQAPLSPSPQILLSRTVRSAPTGCFLDPIRGPCHGSELWRVWPCGLVAVPSRTLFLLPGIPVVPSHTPRSWQTRLPRQGVSPSLWAAAPPPQVWPSNGHSSASHHPGSSWGAGTRPHLLFHLQCPER